MNKLIVIFLMILSTSALAQDEVQFFSKNGESLRLGLSLKPQERGEGVKFFLADNLTLWKHIHGADKRQHGIFKLDEETFKEEKIDPETKTPIIAGIDETLIKQMGKDHTAAMLTLALDQKPKKEGDPAPFRPSSAKITEAVFDPSNQAMHLTITLTYTPQGKSFVPLRFGEDRPVFFFYMPGTQSISYKDSAGDDKTMQVSAANIKLWQIDLKSNDGKKYQTMEIRKEDLTALALLAENVVAGNNVETEKGCDIARGRAFKEE
jgi:hypothetical protein